MKKLIYILIMSLLLSGCSAVENTQEAESTDTPAPTFSIDDLAFYSEVNDTGERTLLLWPGMTEEDMRFDDDEFNSYYSGFETIDYYEPVIKSEQQLSEMTAEKAKPRVRFLSYTGGRKRISTVKDIMTTGLEPVEGSTNSTKEDVIKYYGLDPENESIYISGDNESFSTIVIYFKIDDEGNVTRVISPVGTDVDSIDKVGADAFIRFLIIEDEVRNIQMYREFK